MDPTTPFDRLRRLVLASMLCVAAGLAIAPPAGAQALPPSARPDALGLSAEGMARLDAWLRGEVAAKKIPGAVLMVVRGGKLAYLEAVGVRDPAQAEPMRVDDIFRIYSMTKPIVSVAAMMLVEQGKLQLDAPVAQYLPALAGLKVGVETTEASGRKGLELVAVERPMSVRDLLRHTSGLTYGFFGPGLVKQAYRDSGLESDRTQTNAQFVDRIATLPLAYQPGTTWDYSNSTDVLGRVIEVVSGQTLGAFLQQRIFDPLGMRDTSFHVREPARQARLAEPFPGDGVTPGSALFNPRKPAGFESGGGGLVGTAPDYARFLLMLRGGGQLDGQRILAEATLREMTRDHLGPQVVRTALYLPGADYGYGLGFAVRTLPAKGSDSALGEYYWGGAGGTYMWVDPANDLLVVFMMQSPKQRLPYRTTLRELVYGAVAGPVPAAGR